MGRFRNPMLAEPDRAYGPSQFVGDYLNDRHRRIGELVDAVPGKLRKADELKLYEMAFLARGPILEIGTDRGRSTAVLAIGAADAANGFPIYSIDLLTDSLAAAGENLERLGLRKFVTLVQGDSAQIVAAAEKVFDLAFIDGDHTYEGVKRDLEALRGKVARGGALIFHDFDDPRNDDPAQPDYGVAQAVEAVGEEVGLRFRGGCGAVGIFEQL